MAARGEGVVEDGDGDESEGGEDDEARQPARRHYGDHDEVGGSMGCCLDG